MTFRIQLITLYFIYLQITFIFGQIPLYELSPHHHSRDCRDNNDCGSGCCLVVENNAIDLRGICQPLRQFGEFCAPGNGLRRIRGAEVYKYSCPCQHALICKPLWLRRFYGFSMIQDPRCYPHGLNSKSPILKRILNEKFRTYWNT